MRGPQQVLVRVGAGAAAGTGRRQDQEKGEEKDSEFTVETRHRDANHTTEFEATSNRGAVPFRVSV